MKRTRLASLAALFVAVGALIGCQKNHQGPYYDGWGGCCSQGEGHGGVVQPGPATMPMPYPPPSGPPAYMPPPQAPGAQ